MNTYRVIRAYLQRIADDMGFGEFMRERQTQRDVGNRAKAERDRLDAIDRWETRMIPERQLEHRIKKMPPVQLLDPQSHEFLELVLDEVQEGRVDPMEYHKDVMYWLRKFPKYLEHCAKNEMITEEDMLEIEGMDVDGNTWSTHAVSRWLVDADEKLYDLYRQKVLSLAYFSNSNRRLKQSEIDENFAKTVYDEFLRSGKLRGKFCEEGSRWDSPKIEHFVVLDRVASDIVERL